MSLYLRTYFGKLDPLVEWIALNHSYSDKNFKKNEDMRTVRRMEMK